MVVTSGLLPSAATAAAALGVVLLAFGNYRHRLTVAVLDDLPAVGAAALAAAVVVDALGDDHRTVWVGVLLALLLTVVRGVAHPLTRAARRRGHGTRRTLVVGDGDAGHLIARTALDHPECGVLPVGFVDDPGAPAATRPVDLPVLGEPADLPTLVAQHRASQVVVASGRRDTAMIASLRECDRLRCEILYVPDFLELRHRGRDVEELWGIGLVRLRHATWRSPSWRAKRVLDVVLSSIALLLLAPLMLLVAAAVRLELGGSVIYRQVRVGLDGREFTIFKFRSLRLAEGADVAPVWSINGDARLGPVGRFVRSTSIDELPQLFNVLRGEMSLVGPRPERPVFVDRFAVEVPGYDDRHRAPAGLTGWAQVNGLRGDTSIEERARFDNFYIEHWSLWLDLRIIARTVGSMVFRRGS